MHALIMSRVFGLLLALFAFQVAASGAPSAASVDLSARQSSNVSCEEYATLANLSTIGGNFTFRGAFIQSDLGDGTLKAGAILDNAIAQFTTLALINDTTLNQQCGNLTAVAVAEAPKTFSEGIVGPFHIGAGISLGSGVGSTAAISAVLVAAAMLVL
jgi:hypothetical protein